MPPRIDSTSPASDFNDLGSCSDAETIRPQNGETLEQIAQKLDVDPDALAARNPQIDPKKGLSPFQEVRVPKDLYAANPSEPAPISDPAKTTTAHGPVGDPVANSAMKAQFLAGPTGKRREQWINNLGRDPGEAHLAWKNLSAPEKAQVLAKMEQRYGKEFAQKFLVAANSGKSDVRVSTYGSTPDSKFPMITPEELKARGYKLAGPENTGTGAIDIEVWVHPSGHTIRRDVSTFKWGQETGTDKPPKGGGDVDGPGKKPRVDPPLEPPDETPVDRAWRQLGKLQALNDQARELLNQNPVPWNKFNQAIVQMNSIMNDLDKKVSPPDSEPTIYMEPEFHEQYEAAKEESRNIYSEAQNRNPDWQLGPVVLPDDDEDD